MFVNDFELLRSLNRGGELEILMFDSSNRKSIVNNNQLQICSDYRVCLCLCKVVIVMELLSIREVCCGNY